MVCYGQGQGTLSANLSPYLPYGSTWMASANFTTPAIPDDDPDLRYSVTFDVNVSTTEAVFTIGHFFGDSIAWAFELGDPVVSGDTSEYIGTTDMSLQQIDALYDGGESFEILDDYYTIEMHGEVMPVPEPGTANLLTAGFLFLAFSRHGPIVPRRK